MSASASPVKKPREKKPKKPVEKKATKKAAEKKVAKKAEDKPKKAASKQVKWILVNDGGREPKRATAGSAGYDLFSPENVRLEAGEQVVVPMGIAVAIPKGHYGKLYSRSSLALRRLHVEAGVIDSDYRGELKVVLENRSSETIWLNDGESLAQLVVVQLATVRFVKAKALGKTKRGEGGFGSTNSKPEEKKTKTSSSSDSSSEEKEKTKNKKAKRDASPVRQK